MRKYTCPFCSTTSFIIRQRKRKDSIVYLCKRCKKYFSIKTVWRDTHSILTDHLDGLSFRKLASKYDISPMSAWRICDEELKKLPDNNQFTFRHCNRFSHVFVFDGKFFNVKGYPYNLVLLWGLDYFSHDIPVFTLAPSENYQGWAKYFSYFRIINHHPELLVCDDNANLKMAARNAFPAVKIQTCFNHFKQSIRKTLRVRSDTTYKPFMRRIESIFASKLSDDVMNRWLYTLYRDYHHDPLCLQVLTNIQKYMPELIAYRNIKAAPLTSNLMESYNSHLESRLFSLKSFQSFTHAKLWMNAYILKRRFTKLTDCEGKFRSLNGKRSISLTAKKEVDIPTLF